MTTEKQLQALLDPAKRRDDEMSRYDMIAHAPVLVCSDGFQMSVQASRTHYCAPRDNQGPWCAVEIGFPSARDEKLMPFAEDPEKPTETVYSYVPIDVVAAVVEAHGGMVTP